MVRWLVLQQKTTTWAVIATRWTLTLSDVVGPCLLGPRSGLGLGLGREAIFPES
jgi:hypothetical protein